MKLPAKNGEIWHGDCLDLMRDIPSASVDMILCDLPYGTTACGWDSVIPFEPLWSEYWRIAKPNAAVVLTAAQPFTTALIASQIKNFKYSWYWNKDKAGNFATAKYQPLRVIEDICVFSKQKTNYYPQMVKADENNKRPRNRIDQRQVNHTVAIASGEFKPSETRNENMRYPKNLINIKSTEGECNNLNRIHPTQKPVALFEYLIKTYTNPGDVVMDNCIGSGTTAIAAENTGRRWIGIERDMDYFMKAWQRIMAHDV